MARVNEPPEIERQPASPISYGRWAQRADRQHGRRDGRKRIPSLAEVNALIESEGPAQLPTPYLEMLFSRARDMMEHERLWYIASTGKARAEQAELESQLVAARRALEPADTLREKAKLELTDADLQARHPNEELRSDVFIRLRREAEREQRIANAEAHYLRLTANVHAVEAKLAQVAETVYNRLSIARMRALRISAYFSARTATYWEGLVLAHRDGKHLAPLLPHLTPGLPEWMVPEEPPAPEPAPSTATEVVTQDIRMASTRTGSTRTASTKDEGDAPDADQPAATAAEPAGGADATQSQPQDEAKPVSAHRS
jgi:hypothetical protein